MERILRLLMSLEICSESTLMKSCWGPPHIQMKGVYAEKKSAVSTTRKHKGVYFLVRPYTAQKHYIRRHNMKRELQRKIIHRYYIACVSVAVVGVSRRYTTTIYRRTSLDEALSRLVVVYSCGEGRLHSEVFSYTLLTSQHSFLSCRGG